MRAFLPALLILCCNCATVLRSANHPIDIYGPDDLQVFDGARPVPLAREGREDGQTKFSATLDRHVPSLTLQSQGVRTEVALTDHVSLGWLLVDLALFWPLTIPIDAISGNWKSFTDVRDVSFGPTAKGSAPPPAAPVQRAAPPPQAVAQQQPPPSRTRGLVIDRGKLAVLDFKNSAKDLQAEEVRYFTDVVRGASLKVAPGLEVMTRENLISLLQATGKELGQCEGECEVDTGRRIGADAIISGDVLKVGSRFHISLRLHETRDGRLLSSSIATGRTVDELDETLQTAASDLLMPAR